MTKLRANHRVPNEVDPDDAPPVAKLTFRMGMLDVAEERSFPRWYETAHETVQRNYEIGREAGNYLLAGGVDPKRWMNRRLSEVYARAKKISTEINIRSGA
jgi:hypothetical protein